MYVSMGTILINPPALREAQAGRAYVFLMFYFLYFQWLLLDQLFQRLPDRSLRNLQDYFSRTLAVGEWSEVIFRPLRDVAVATNFVGKRQKSNTHLVVRMTFARAAPQAYDKKGNCFAGHRKQITWLDGRRRTI